MLQRGAGRVVALFICALIVERLARGLSPAASFVVVFVAVFVLDNLRRLFGGSDRPLFLEDVVLGLIIYSASGYLSSFLDSLLSVYTGRHASPVVPAVVLALLDKSWPSRDLSSKRR